VAAYGIAARLEFLVIPLAWGVGSALTALVGRTVGAGDWPTARRTAWLGGAMAFGATALIGLAVGLFAPAFAGLFSSDPAVAGLAARALRYTGPAFGGFGLGMAMYFASMGAQRMWAPVIAGVSRLLIATLGGWCLANLTGLGTEGHFLGVALGITAYGLITASGVRPAAWRARPGR
jgi:Na+-driven multidrug efflux pump